jgi:uncharacterized phiE125 gp8 family phage protein
MRLELITGSSDPITRAEAKTHCRIPTTYTAEDTYIDGLITSARVYLERRTGRQIVTATWNGFDDEFPEWELELPRFPLASVTHVKYYDSDGVLQTFDSAKYIVDTASQPGVIVPAPDQEWPDVQTDRRNAVEVRFIAGQAVASVPGDIKQLVKFLVAHLYENREPVNIGNIVTPIPFAVESMITALKPRGLS